MNEKMPEYLLEGRGFVFLQSLSSSNWASLSCSHCNEGTIRQGQLFHEKLKLLGLEECVKGPEWTFALRGPECWEGESIATCSSGQIPEVPFPS